MDGLGITKRDVEQSIQKGMKWKEEHENKWHARMANIEVVFSKDENELVIITVYYAGEPK